MMYSAMIKLYPSLLPSLSSLPPSHSFSLSLQAGALLACGIVNVGVRNECDPALALLSDYVLHASSAMRLGAVIG